jgi:thiol-disulfide isomerase/thioredoxin
MTPGRRRLMLGGVALSAGAAGLGVGSGLWRKKTEPQTGPAQVGDPETAFLWDLSFTQPDGATLALASLRGKPLLINFWATWCPPCVKEMPEFDRFHREYSGRGWQVLGLAVDSPTPVRDFLKRVPVGYTIALAGFEGTEMSRKLGNPQGALPFTVMIGASGKALQRHLGETTFDALANWARQT